MPWLREPITADRILLRAAAPGDEPANIALFTDPDVRQYVGGPLSHEEAKRRIGPYSATPQDKWWGHFMIIAKSTRALIGTLSFAQKRGPWELSFQLRHDRWGQGLAREAVQASLAWF